MIVTFVGPVAGASDRADLTAFWASFDTCQETPDEPALKTLVAERRSKPLASGE